MKQTPRPCEPLEARRLLAATSIGEGSIIVVTDDDSADTIVVQPESDIGTDVFVNGVEVTGFLNSFFSGLKILGNGGNDKITVASSVTVPVTLLGGAGNDFLDGGLGGDTMKGGGGKDTVDYSSRTTAVIVGVGTVSDDGAAGEH